MGLWLWRRGVVDRGLSGGVSDWLSGGKEVRADSVKEQTGSLCT